MTGSLVFAGEPPKADGSCTTRKLRVPAGSGQSERFGEDRIVSTRKPLTSLLRPEDQIRGGRADCVGWDIGAASSSVAAAGHVL
jgi:hypothetical protein